MKSIVLVAASAAALALAGCNQAETPTTDMAATDAPAGDAAAVAPNAMTTNAAVPAAAQTFANEAAASDAFEIQSSQLAARNASSDKVKDFARQMIEAHRNSTAKLNDAASSASPAITPNPALSPMQQQTLDSLSGLNGAAFDTAYTRAQVEAHQMTLDKLRTYSQNGDVPTLRAFATEMVPVVTAHLNMAKAL